MGGVSASAENPSAGDGTTPTPSATDPDPETIEAAHTFDDLDPDSPLDQVDRSLVISEWLKSVAMWSLRLLIIAAAAYVGWYLLKQFWQGVLPVILAIIVCTVLAPPVTWMRRRRVPGALAALLTLLGALAAIIGLLIFIAPDIASQSQTLYLQVLTGVQQLQLWLEGPPLNLDGEDLDQIINEAAAWLQERAGAIAGGIFSGIGTATSIIVTLGIVLVLTFFFLKDGHRFLPWVRAVSGRRVGSHMTEVLTRAWTTLGGFIRAQALVSFIDAFFIGIGLVLIGVPLALPLAVITFIAGFIPYVGAIVAGALSVLVALVSLGFTEAVLVLILVLAVQQLEGNILSPFLQSRAMDLHPVIVLVSVTIGGGLFGIVGAFLAVPVAAMIAVGFRYLQDMTALEAGEKKAADIAFATPSGTATGRYAEEKGRRMRERMRNSIILVDEVDEAEQDAAAKKMAEQAGSGTSAGTGPPPGSRSGRGAGRRTTRSRGLRDFRGLSNSAIERMFTFLRRH